MNYNDYFSIEDAIGTEITENEFQVLMASKRVFTTSCRMDRGQAHSAMGGDIMRFEEEERTYGGMIVTNNPNDFNEACEIAKQRGFGEKVEGVLYGIVPYNAEIINPCDTSKNLN